MNLYASGEVFQPLGNNSLPLLFSSSALNYPMKKQISKFEIVKYRKQTSSPIHKHLKSKS